MRPRARSLADVSTASDSYEISMLTLPLPGHDVVRSALGPSSAYTAYLRRNARNLPAQMPAVAILLQMRNVSTDTHTSGGASSGPPPGFNAEKAKKPLPKDSEKSAKSAP